MLKFLKNWTLPFAMLMGALCYFVFAWLPCLSPLKPFVFSSVSLLTPVLIFVMLLLTFCKVSPKDLKISKLHIWLMLMQILGGCLLYLLLCSYDKIVAEAAFVCLLAPTATAAAVITGKLGGNVTSLTTYTLVSNIATAITVPVLFPLVESHTGLNFWDASFQILMKIFPLLICPFLAAWALRIVLPKLHARLLNLHELAFYLWGVSLAIVTGETVRSLVNSTAEVHVEIMVAVIALVTCCLQFFLGKTIGSVYHDRISGGQALGQKNTILAIWMAYTFLNPLSSVGPGSYVLWQNIINSWQLWKKRKK